MTDTPIRERLARGKIVNGRYWPPAHERFAEFYMPEPNSGCWIWIGSRKPDGYGIFWVDDKCEGAHRWSFEHHVGAIPDGLVIDHLCRQPWCVNPDHLEAVTHRENVLRGVSVLADHARQTHCKRGHELTEDNIYRPPNRNERICRQCSRLKSARLAAKRKRLRAERRDGGS